MTYSQVTFVSDALQSVIDQDYPNLQIVVADDGSRDGTQDIIRDFAERFPSSIVPVLADKNQGIARNGNSGLARCTGKYVALLDGDDLFLPGKLRAQAAWLEAHPGAVICGHDIEHFDGATGATISLWSDWIALQEGAGLDEVIRAASPPFITCATMVRTDALPPPGFDERLQYLWDWKLAIDVLRGGGSFGQVDGILARHRVHAGGVWTGGLHDRNRRQILLRDRLITLSDVEATRSEYLPACTVARGKLLLQEAFARFDERDPIGARRYLRAAIRCGRELDRRTVALLALSFLPGSSGLTMHATIAKARRGIRRAAHLTHRALDASGVKVEPAKRVRQSRRPT